MKLSVTMIENLLTDWAMAGDENPLDQDELTLERCIFYEGETTLVGDTIYLIPENMHLPEESVEAEPGCVLICCGSVPEKIMGTIFYKADGSILEAANRIWGLFEHYQHITEKVYGVIQSRDSLQALVEAATPLFENEITIRNPDYRYLATSYPRVLYQGSGDADQPDELGYASVNEIDSLKKDHGYHENEEPNTPFLYPYNGYELWCYDLFLSERFVCRVKISNVRHPFRSFDRSLLVCFAEFLRLYFLNSHDMISSEAETMDEHLASLLDGSKYYMEQDLRYLIRPLGWKIDDCYLVLYCRPGQNNNEMQAYPYYCMYLRKNFSHVYPLVWKDRLVLIVNISCGYGDTSDFLGKFADFVRDENFRAGISMSFSDFSKLPLYCKQAQIALRQGLRYDPSIWTYRFANYRLPYLLSKMEEDFSDSSGFLPALHELWLEDQREGSELIKTLKMYLDKDQNLSRTANALYIHRSTLEYRLEKIRSRLHMDLSKPKNRYLIGLLLTFQELDEHFL